MKRNRGKAPNDDQLFNIRYQDVFYEALKDMNYLLSRGYGSKSSLQLVGNRHRLNARQQKALLGMSAADSSIQIRKQKEVSESILADKTIAIDAFNLLIILESALSNAYLFKGMEGAYRDINAVHGGYKKVHQTTEAIDLIAEMFKDLKVKKVIWYLDAPISNSGRLKTFLRAVAEESKYNWEVHLVNNPDKMLIASNHTVISSDAFILENCTYWFNAIEYIIFKNKIQVPTIYAYPPQKIAIITCVKEKKEHSCPALEMYQGELFKQLYEAATEIYPDQSYILSGKHHLLALDQIIAPYDLNLDLQSEDYQTKWATKVLTDLKKRTNLKHDVFYFFTNKNYCKNLIPHINHFFIPIDL